VDKPAWCQRYKRIFFVTDAAVAKKLDRLSLAFFQICPIFARMAGFFLTVVHFGRLRSCSQILDCLLLRQWRRKKYFFNTSTRAQCYKTFYVCNLRIFTIIQSDCRTIQPRQMFVSKARVYPSGDKLLDVSTNIRLGWKGLPRTNTPWGFTIKHYGSAMYGKWTDFMRSWSLLLFDHKHINSEKHSSLLRNQCITSP
jgi:hypothetical protein